MGVFTKTAVATALTAAIVLGGAQAKKKEPKVTSKVFFDIEIGKQPSLPLPFLSAPLRSNALRAPSQAARPPAAS